MQIFVISEIIILLYCLNGIYGAIFSGVVFCVLFFRRRDLLIERFLKSLIYCIPITYIGILGKEQSHMFSWYFLLLFLYMIYCVYTIFKKKLRLNRNMLCLVIITVLYILIRNCFGIEGIKEGLSETLKVILLVGSIYFSYEIFKYYSTYFNMIKMKDIINRVIKVILATAVGVIIQCILERVYSIEIGFSTHFAARVTYDLLYKGYSELSIVLGIGFVLEGIKLLDKIKIISIFRALLFLVAIAINSSRTGLVSAVLVVVLLIFSNVIHGKISPKIVVITCIIGIVSAAGMILITKSRGLEMGELLDNNGRFANYLDGWNVFKRSNWNLLFGTGILTVHNSILEIFYSYGVLGSILLFGVITNFGIWIKQCKEKYIFLHIGIASLFVTSLFSKYYIGIFAFVLLLEARVQRNEINLKRRIK